MSISFISVAGMGVGFPIGVGLALIVGVIWNYIVNPQGNPFLLFIGVALIVGAIVADAIAYRAYAVSRSTGDKADAEAKRAATWKGIRLAIVGGILMGTFYPLVEIGKTGPNGLGPYAVGFVFSLGILASVFVYNLYFLRFPEVTVVGASPEPMVRLDYQPDNASNTTQDSGCQKRRGPTVSLSDYRC